MRVAGVNIPKNKRVEIALTAIYGIGESTVQDILAQANVNPDTRVKDLTQDEENVLRSLIEKQYKTEGDLRREINANIKRLKDTKAYRGIRHARRLPARGQRTKTNSRTVRGNKRNMAASGKPKAAQKT